jgi:hypothetical protein
MPAHVPQGAGLGPVKSPKTASEAVMQVARKAFAFPECKNTLDCKCPLCVPPRYRPAPCEMPPDSFDELFEASPKLAFLGWSGFLRAHAEAEDPLSAMLRPKLLTIVPLPRQRPKRPSVSDKVREPRLLITWAPPAPAAVSGIRVSPAPARGDLRRTPRAGHPAPRPSETTAGETHPIVPTAGFRLAGFAHPAPVPAEADVVPAAFERRILSQESTGKVPPAPIRSTDASSRQPGPDPLAQALNAPRFTPMPPPQGGPPGAPARPGQIDPDQARRLRLVHLLRQLLLTLSLGPKTARELRKALFALMKPGSKVPSDDAVKAWLGRILQE